MDHARYAGEPLPRPPTDDPNRAQQIIEQGGPSPILDGADNIPIDLTPHAKVQRSPLDLPIIVHPGSIEVSQASGGRRVIDNRLSLPVQSLDSPQPDPRRIARPIPEAWDKGTAISGGRNG